MVNSTIRNEYFDICFFLQFLTKAGISTTYIYSSLDQTGEFGIKMNK